MASANNDNHFFVFITCFLPYYTGKELCCGVDRSYDSKEKAVKVFDAFFFIIPRNFLSIPRLLRSFKINKCYNDHMIFLFIIANVMINFKKYKLILQSLKEHNFIRFLSHTCFYLLIFSLEKI